MSQGGKTSLGLAAEHGHSQIVEKLILSGANKDHKDLEGRTPLMLAAINQRAAAVEILCRSQARINDSDNEGDPALCAMCATGVDRKEVVQILLDGGADPNAVNKRGCPALLVAIQARNEDMAMFLLQHGAKYEACTERKESAVHLCAKGGQQHALALLLELGAPTEERDERHHTPLIAAVTRRDFQMCALLLEESRGMDMDLSDDGGATALLWAAYLDNVEI
eukprot:gene3470-4310_t